MNIKIYCILQWIFINNVCSVVLYYHTTMYIDPNEDRVSNITLGIVNTINSNNNDMNHDDGYTIEKHFYDICESGNLDLAREFYQMNHIDLKSNSELFVACFTTHLSIAQWLHSLNAYLDHTKLLFESLFSDISIVKWLYEKEKDNINIDIFTNILSRRLSSFCNHMAIRSNYVKAYEIAQWLEAICYFTFTTTNAHIDICIKHLNRYYYASQTRYCLCANAQQNIAMCMHANDPVS